MALSLMRSCQRPVADSPLKAESGCSGCQDPENGAVPLEIWRSLLSLNVVRSALQSVPDVPKLSPDDPRLWTS